MVNERNSKISLWEICAAGAFLTVAFNSNVIAGVESLNLDQVKQGLGYGLGSHRSIPDFLYAYRLWHGRSWI